MAKTIRIEELGATIENIVGALKTHQDRIKKAPLQFLLGQMLKRIHENGETSDNNVMRYKDSRHITERMSGGYRTDRKDLSWTEQSLFFGLQLVNGQLEFVGRRKTDSGSIPVQQLAEFMETQVGEDIWRPSDKELKEIPKRFLLELEKVLKEKL